MKHAHCFVSVSWSRMGKHKSRNSRYLSLDLKSIIVDIYVVVNCDESVNQWDRWRIVDAAKDSQIRKREKLSRGKRDAWSCRIWPLFLSRGWALTWKSLNQSIYQSRGKWAQASLWMSNRRLLTLFASFFWMYLTSVPIELLSAYPNSFFVLVSRAASSIRIDYVRWSIIKFCRGHS